MRIRLLFVIDNLQFGGGERVFAQIINGLSPEKYEIFVACLPSKQFYQSINNNRVRFFALDFSKRVSFSLITKLTQIIKRNKIDIVHGQGARAEFYARLANKLVGKSSYISTIAMPVEGFDVGFFSKKVYCFFDRFSERFVDQFIVVSEALRRGLVESHGIPAEKVVKIYNGIEIDHYVPLIEGERVNGIRAEFNLPSECILIGAIGRLVWQKGFEYLVESLPDIVKTFHNVRVLIVGEGPLRESLKAIGNRLNVEENLVFAGFRKDVKEILSAFDIFVIPSLLEGFPMVTLEAMAMAKPIIATGIDGIREQIVPGNSGILVPPGDPDAIGKAVMHILGSKGMAKNLGLNARKKVEEQFTIAGMVAETEKVYRSLRENRGELAEEAK